MVGKNKVKNPELPTGMTIVRKKSRENFYLALRVYNQEQTESFSMNFSEDSYEHALRLVFAKLGELRGPLDITYNDVQWPSFEVIAARYGLKVVAAPRPRLRPI